MAYSSPTACAVGHKMPPASRASRRPPRIDPAPLSEGGLEEEREAVIRPVRRHDPSF
jgi:hypothetical protein